MSDPSDPQRLDNVVYDHEGRIQALEQELLDVDQETGEAGEVETIPNPVDGDCGCCPDDWLGTGDPPLVPPGTVPGGGTNPPPDDLGECTGAALTIVNGPFPLHWNRTNLNATGTYPERTAITYITAYLRPSSASAKSFIDLTPWAFVGEALDHLHVYAISAVGAIVAAATITGTIAEFSPSVATLIAGFLVELDADTDTDFGWVRGSLVTGGGAGPYGPGSTDSDGDLITGAGIIAGNYYWVDNAADGLGSWRETGLGTNRSDIEVALDGVWRGHIGSSAHGGGLGTYHADLDYPLMAQEMTVSQNDFDHFIFYYPGGDFRIRVYSTSFGDNVDVNGGMVTQVYDVSDPGDRQVTITDNSAYSLCEA